VKEISDLLWDFDDGVNRKRWEKRRYRGLHQRALQIVCIHSGDDAAQRLHNEIKRKFVLTNWLLPYPNKERFWQKSGGYRRWVSVYHQELMKSKYRNREMKFKQLERECLDRKYGFWVRKRIEYEKNYMDGWDLSGEVHGGVMEGIPVDEESIVYGENVDMEQLGVELELIYERTNVEGEVEDINE
jgi:hypothetical protein